MNDERGDRIIYRLILFSNQFYSILFYLIQPYSNIYFYCLLESLHEVLGDAIVFFFFFCLAEMYNNTCTPFSLSMFDYNK